MKGISSIQRLSRDISELFASDFNCTASHLYVKQTGDSLNELGAISLESHVFEGPYRGGRFHFCFHISGNYPFKPVEIWATQPIWHPNIDIRTGKVALPLEWSPVLTLHALALAVQMLLLEPSVENPLNLESYSYYISKPDLFEKQAQQSLKGGWISGVHFPNACLSFQEIEESVQTYPVNIKRMHDEAMMMQMPTNTSSSSSSRASSTGSTPAYNLPTFPSSSSSSTVASVFPFPSSSSASSFTSNLYQRPNKRRRRYSLAELNVTTEEEEEEEDDDEEGEDYNDTEGDDRFYQEIGDDEEEGVNKGGRRRGVDDENDDEDEDEDRLQRKRKSRIPMMKDVENDENYHNQLHYSSPSSHQHLPPYHVMIERNGYHAMNESPMKRTRYENNNLNNGSSVHKDISLAYSKLSLRHDFPNSPSHQLQHQHQQQHQQQFQFHSQLPSFGNLISAQTHQSFLPSPQKASSDTGMSP